MHNVKLRNHFLPIRIGYRYFSLSFTTWSNVTWRVLDITKLSILDAWRRNVEHVHLQTIDLTTCLSIHATHLLSMVDIYAMLFENPSQINKASTNTRTPNNPFGDYVSTKTIGILLAKLFNSGVRWWLSDVWMPGQENSHNLNSSFSDKRNTTQIS